ncbi:MAG: hypothetical protein ACI4CE_07460 [Methanomethylophilus alvi]
MEIKTRLNYVEAYVPPRCRKVRYRPVVDFTNIRLREVDKNDMTLAYEDKSYAGRGKIYRYKGHLWAKERLHPSIRDQFEGRIKTALDWLVFCHERYPNYAYPWMDTEERTKENTLKAARCALSRRILVNGELYERVTRPEYLIMTFGSGNGDGTGLFVEYPARRDCGWHFPAHKGDEAVAKATRIALGRGDVDSVKLFKKYIVCYE